MSTTLSSEIEDALEEASVAALGEVPNPGFKKREVEDEDSIGEGENNQDA